MRARSCQSVLLKFREDAYLFQQLRAHIAASKIECSALARREMDNSSETAAAGTAGDAGWVNRPRTVSSPYAILEFRNDERARASSPCISRENNNLLVPASFLKCSALERGMALRGAAELDDLGLLPTAAAAAGDAGCNAGWVNSASTASSLYA